MAVQIHNITSKWCYELKANFTLYNYTVPGNVASHVSMLAC